MGLCTFSLSISIPNDFLYQLILAIFISWLLALSLAYRTSIYIEARTQSVTCTNVLK